MNTYEFELVLSGLDLDADDQALSEFGTDVDDMTFAELAGTVIASVERVAATFSDAIRSAIADVEAIPGVVVRRVLPDEFVSQIEIANRVGRTRQSVSQHVNGDRGPGGFPPPAFGSGRTAVWRWASVANWLTNAGMDSPGISPHAAVVEAVNALLEARRAVGNLDEADRVQLRRLVA